jgi:hypothetical protein
MLRAPHSPPRHGIVLQEAMSLMVKRACSLSTFIC